MKIWVLTKEYNDYDQHGEYFVAAFSAKPTAEQLAKVDVHANEASHVISGGGRRSGEDSWYWLREYDC